MDIVRFRGGLGNQMFQYALLRTLSSQGREVMVSLGFYRKNPNVMPFVLKKVFGNVSFRVIDERIFEEIDKQWREIKQDGKRLDKFIEDYPNRFFWVEEPMIGIYDEHIFKTKHCTFVGYWQTEKYFKDIKEEILWNFQFAEGEKCLRVLKEKLLSGDNYVSVHIRRGDYLTISELYGNICTDQYYEAAMRFVGERLNSPVFVFFSDDIKWVEEHYKFHNAIYIKADMFRDYQAWYDMCLMSCCAYHIIANSSFSWWGAWLDKRKEKNVIAPKQWLNGYAMPDICPDEWVRL